MVDILLATYNGEAWLEEQIASLMAQDFQDWRLLVRDDGSKDGTLAFLRAQQTRLGDRLIIYEDEGTNLGAAGNFARLMERSTAPYLMLCDQDDVWLPEKISLTFARMKESEKAYGAETPLMVHTDFGIVDDKLSPIADSGHRFQQINAERGGTLGRLLVQNVATGCTIMLNKALRELALPLPANALMHDHWLSLVAACFGKIVYLPVPTLLYRQHGGNAVGAQAWNPLYAARLLFRLSLVGEVMARNRVQAKAFYERYRDIMGSNERATLDAFIRMPVFGFFEKRRAILRYGFFYSGAIRNIGWMLLC
ncbi:glycosyltransferase family 2 protein [Desulfuromonas sp. KJ2020]|uniref:glycosyltransferase family 2 protein n=1 Tax=Desulfuromonas sp. KJ2020 TaxID=2919173 RepID=UPI0020A82B32|nr:glycosyltransferase family 2 protein [Desulfuromonas sp. KJ2020]MCP3175630.1 glycosyltransferase family 2 protein [Desulfuromonas sp. KJ2020]